MSATSAILTVEKEDAPVLRCNRGSFLYEMYEDEFLQTFGEGHSLNCEQEFDIRSDQITVQDVKSIAGRLEIDAGLLEEDYNSIYDTLKEHRDPYER
jgi:hypothetical protein